jgi:hypothetical protein
VADEVRIQVSGAFDAWIDGLGAIEREMVIAAATPWKAAADVFFDRTQQFVHVLTGDLKASGQRAEIKHDFAALVAEVVYDSDHAIYELRRGGTHDFYGRALESTNDLFERALGQGFERMVATWR